MQESLRIGFVCVQDAADINVWSGTPFHVLDGLRKLSVPVEVYSPLSRRIRYLLAPVAALSRLRKSGGSVEHYPLMIESYARQISRAIKERPVDVIVSTSSIPVAALRCSQPIIFWTDAVFHEMHGYYEGFGGTAPAGIERGKRVEEMALSNCTFAAYSSEWAARSARQLTEPTKISVLPFGPNFEIKHTRSNIEQWAAERRQERPRQCELLFIGMDWKRKGGAIAVETARILNERGLATRLTVVGSQPPEPCPDYVRPLGFISKTTREGRGQLESLLRQSDFFILPTAAEASAIVFCEASAFGLPTLSYATGGVPDYVKTGVNGFCLPIGAPAAAFADAIENNLADTAGYRALCLGAFDQYAGRLNWDTSVGGLLALCRRAVEQSTRPSAH